MSILLTGGTGSTSSQVVKFLSASNVPFLIASRRGAAGATSPELVQHMVKFDYADESTWEALFEQGIKAVYLVMPATADPWGDISKLAEFAAGKGGLCQTINLKLHTDEESQKICTSRRRISIQRQRRARTGLAKAE
jgi:NAD dependent epimerase/dehydratase family